MRAGVLRDAARGFSLLSEAVELGFDQAQYRVARCYLKGEGVEKDAAHGVKLLRKAAVQEDCNQASAQADLALCYMQGYGVDADTVQAAFWSKKAAKGGDLAQGAADELAAFIRRCAFCGTAPAHKHCGRCRKVRYCDATC